ERLLSPDTQSEPIVIKLGKGYTLTGKVTNSKDEVVAGRVLVTPGTAGFTWGSSFLRHSVLIDEAGIYRLEGLPPGPSSLVVAPETGTPVPAGAVKIPDLERYDIRIGEGAKIEGTITDEQGEPIQGAEVRATLYRDMGNQYFGASAISDEEGKYLLPELPAGNLNGVIVVCQGYARYPPPGEFRENQVLSAGTSLRIDIKLKKGGALRGKVTRKSDGKALSGARVVAIPRSSWGGGAQENSTTAEDGTYRIENLAPGEYAIQVLAEGCFQPDFPNPWQAGRAGQKLDDKWKVNIPLDGGETEKDLELEIGGEISGWVEDNQGERVSGVSIRVSNVSNQLPVLTDKKGEFKVTGVKGGNRIRVYANAPGRWARTDPPISVSPGGKVEGVVLRLKATIKVSGIVETSDGKPPEGGVVRVVNGDPRRNKWLLRSGGKSVPVGPDGAFEVENVTPGLISVIASAPGYMRGFSDARTVSEGTDMEGVHVILTAGHGISGFVRLKTGEPVAHAEISVHEDSGGWYYGENGTVAQTDDHGHFTIDGLGEGKYRVNARKEGLSPASKSGIRPTTGEEVQLEMQAGGEISGRVFDMQGNGVGGLHVSLQVLQGRQPPVMPSTSTSGDGTFKLTGVLDGYYRVNVAPGWNSRLNFTQGSHEGARPGDTGIEIQVQLGQKISGRVIDGAGQPMGRIRLYSNPVEGGSRSSNTQTDADGTFELVGLSFGSHNIRVEARGEFASVTEPNVGAGTEGITITIGKAQVIEGIVVDMNGTPVNGVSINARPMPGSTGTHRWSRTRNDGTFKVTRLAPGNYQLTFTATGRFATQTISDVASGASGVAVQMYVGEMIAGIAVDRAGKPVRGSRIKAVPIHGGPSSSASTNHEGKFKIVGLEQGPHRLTASANSAGYLLEEPVEAETGKKDVKLVLHLGLSIRGQIVDATGRGVRGWVYIVSGGGSYRGRWYSADRDGNFSIVGLPEGKLKIRTWVSGYEQIDTECYAGNQSVQLQVR
ncbi:MAG: carboxypeptidase-like regulatory domain-containing protein, partial [Planctomycetota bacterium]